MRNALKSLFTNATRHRNTMRRRHQFGKASPTAPRFAVEKLEAKQLLTSQLITSDAATKTLDAGQTIDIPVIYQTVNANGDPTDQKANLFSFNLHFDADVLTYVSTTDIFAEGITVAPNEARSESDPGVTGDDNDTATETALTAGYFDNDFVLNPGWPNAHSTNGQVLYIARFTAKPGFNGTTINFSANDTGNVVGEPAQFGFQSQSVVLEPSVVTPTVSIANAADTTEGANAQFTVTLSATATGTVTVDYSTADPASGSPDTIATSGIDYAARTNQTVTFQEGETQKTILIPTVDDTSVENDEFFNVTLSNASGATISGGPATAKIVDNDTSLPIVSIADADAVTEGEIADFQVTLSQPATQTITVLYSTNDGNGPNGAIGGDDFFTQTNQTLTFNVGETTKTISIATEDDPIDEETETFHVTLSSSTGAAIGRAQATGTINDNEVASVGISIADASPIVEGNNAVFLVTLSSASTGIVTVNYSTVDGDGPTAAEAGTDFNAATNQTLTFSAGETQKSIQIVTTDDPQTEGEETFSVALSNPVGGVITQGVATGTIRDNDTPVPSVSISDATPVTEGADAFFTVTLNVASDETVTVEYSTQDGSGPVAALGGSDYIAQIDQILTFTPGQTQHTIAISTIDDSVQESNEEFSVRLGNINGAVPANFEATGTIVDNDDQLPQISVSDATPVEEGSPAVFTISLDTASANTVTVNYSTADDNGPTAATAGSDYTATTEILTFAPGQTERTVSIPTIDDSQAESSETFLLMLSNAEGATIGSTQATATIDDNDTAPPPVLSISDAASVVEGGASVFTVTLSFDPSSVVTVDLTTNGAAPNPATAGSDFQSRNEVLTFSPGGSLSQQISVATLDDDAIEDDEYIAATLSGAIGATIGRGQATGIIEDNDAVASDAVIQGRKFSDLNADGFRDANEPWLNGWTIQLVDTNGNIIDEQVTSDIDFNGDSQIDPQTETGWYRFIVAPGTYSVAEVRQPGWRQTAPGTSQAARAYQLDQERKFHSTINTFENWGGLNERWFLGEDKQWYFVTPGGTLYEWNGSGRNNLTGTILETFDSTYYDDPSLIYDAPFAESPTYTVEAGETSQNINFGNFNFSLEGSVHGRKWHDLNGDGLRSDNEAWLNGWVIELVSPAGDIVQTATTMDVDLNGDDQIDPETESGWYWFTGVTAGNWRVREQQQPGWHQTSGVNQDDRTAFELDQQYGLRFSRSQFPDWGGRNERWIRGSEDWFYIEPNGDFYRWNGSPRNNLTGQLIERVSPEFHGDIARLYNARNPFERSIEVRPGEALEDIDFGNRRDEDGGPVNPSDFDGMGNITVRVSGSSLVLTGDNHANGVLISRNQDGWVTISGLSRTTINGQPQHVMQGWTEVAGNITGNFHDGGDAVVVDDLRVGGTIAINTHGGNDFVIGNDLNIGRHFDIRSNTGDNTVLLQNSTVGDLARSITGTGSDVVGIKDTGVRRGSFSTGGGNDLFATERSTVTFDVSLNTGSGNDSVIAAANNVGRRTVIDGSSGTDAVSVDDANVFQRTPVLRRFEQDSIANVDELLDSIMQRLADAGLDNLLAAS